MSSVRGRRDGSRSIRYRAAEPTTRTGDWLPLADNDGTPRDPHARTVRRAPARRSSSIPGWLRALFFLPAPAMAHRDSHLGETGPMAHQLGQPAEFQSPLHDPPARLAAAGRSGRRRPHAAEQRRRELAALLGLLLVASAFSVAGPITGLGVTPDPTPIYVIAGETDTSTARADADVVALVPAGTFALDPTYLAPPTPVPTKKPTPKPVVVRSFVALGDSLTAWPAYNPWPTRLDAQDAVLRLVKNAGVPGNTTSQMRARLSKDVYPYKPQVLLVLGGTNDLGYGISESAIIANLRAIVVDAKAHKVMPILINVPPDAYPSMAPKIRSLNAAILKLANSQKIHVVDLYSALANSNGTFDPKYTSDGLHFSDLGCQAAANQIRAQLRKLGL
jgi:lysophospholipase L1-like esterase